MRYRLEFILQSSETHISIQSLILIVLFQKKQKRGKKRMVLILASSLIRNIITGQ